jgi:hypothetical protein
MVADVAWPAGSSSAGAGSARAVSAEDGTIPNLKTASATRATAAAEQMTRDANI